VYLGRRQALLPWLQQLDRTEDSLDCSGHRDSQFRYTYRIADAASLGQIRLNLAKLVRPQLQEHVRKMLRDEGV